MLGTFIFILVFILLGTRVQSAFSKVENKCKRESEVDEYEKIVFLGKVALISYTVHITGLAILLLYEIYKAIAKRISFEIYRKRQIDRILYDDETRTPDTIRNESPFKETKVSKLRDRDNAASLAASIGTLDLENSRHQNAAFYDVEISEKQRPRNFAEENVEVH